MKLSKIYIYPIKSLRPVECDSATLTQDGIVHDRRFMMLKRNPQTNKGVTIDTDGEPPCEWVNMAITENNQMVRFFQSVKFPSHSYAMDGILTVTYRPVNSPPTEAESLDIPLTPNINELKQTQISMHNSPTRAYRMPDAINNWFSTCFGFETMLIYLGPHRRPVLSSTQTHSAVQLAKNETLPLPADPAATDESTANNGGGGWLASATNFAANFLFAQPTATNPSSRPGITFADCAPFLIVSSKSLEDVSSRLPEGEDFDITKFRPNIVIDGAGEVWEEDFWAELTVKSKNEADGEVATLHCMHNCVRCISINVDYDTGAQGLGPSGKMLKLLSRDRRVDPGVKYSPVFGRYTFLDAKSGGKVVRVGDGIAVVTRNQKHTTTDWPL